MGDMAISRFLIITSLVLCTSCHRVLKPDSIPNRVATSFWKIAPNACPEREGYTVIQAEGKTRHCYPITSWRDTPEVDTYHQLHHHGVAVESELMAYRIYFDKKQTIDVYCKRTPRLELATSYWYPNDSLLAEHYGDDILRVSGTVGVGSVKYWNDKLFHIEHVDERQQWISRQTPDTAIINVADINWVLPEDKNNSHNSRNVRNMTIQYTMCAEHRDMRCDVYLSDKINGLCTGVQCIPAKNPAPDSDTTVIYLPNGTLLASWGTDWPVNDTVKFAKETVGLGVFIPKEFAGTPIQDKRNNLCLLIPGDFASNATDITFTEGDKPATCHFYLTCVGATKEDNPVARNAQEWYNYLIQWAKFLK